MENKGKILITGCAGYLGSALAGTMLKQNYQVRAVDNFDRQQCDSLLQYVPDKNFEFMRGDITIEKDVEQVVDGVDAIINLAAIVGFPAVAARPQLATIVNVDGVRNLLEARQYDVPFIQSSTGSCYGAVEGICTEDTPLNPQSLYGENKRDAEKIVESYNNTLSYRFATAFGSSPNMRVNLLINDLVNQAMNNGILNIFQADFRRTFIHISDIASAFIFGVEHMDHFEHQVYNCGSNELNWTKREVAEYISDKTGCLVHYAEIGEDLDKRDYSTSYERLTAEGWEAKVSMEEGIDEIIKTVPILRNRAYYQ